MEDDGYLRASDGGVIKIMSSYFPKSSALPSINNDIHIESVSILRCSSGEVCEKSKVRFLAACLTPEQIRQIVDTNRPTLVCQQCEPVLVREHSENIIGDF